MSDNAKILGGVLGAAAVAALGAVALTGKDPAPVRDPLPEERAPASECVAKIAPRVRAGGTTPQTVRVSAETLPPGWVRADGEDVVTLPCADLVAIDAGTLVEPKLQPSALPCLVGEVQKGGRRYVGKCCGACVCTGSCRQTVEVELAGHETWQRLLCEAVPTDARCGK